MTDTRDPRNSTDSKPLHEGEIEYGEYDASMYGPVSNWATDIDHADPNYNPNAPEIWKDLRDSGCPIAHTERYGGMWAPITHELVNEVAYDTENFTSRGVVVNTGRPDIPPPVGFAPPITSDPPFHKIARRLLLPPFAPKKIEPWEPEIRRLCNKLLDRMGDIEPGETVIDAALQYAQHIPVNVIGRMLGFPEADEDLFREFVHNTLELINEPVAVREQAGEKLDAYLDIQIADHIDNPRDDLTTYMLEAEIDGMKLEPDHVRGSIVLLLIAGIDTTWSAIGSSLWHLAQHPEDRQRLTDEPDVMVFALEEFLRSYAPVTMARLVLKDNDFHGCPMKVDDWVLLPFPAANRDPRVFEDADTFIIDREANRHAAFGLGIHRCLGSNLARLELKVAIEEFVARFPDFELAGDTSWSVGQIRGPRTMPVRVLQTAG
jgi:cytochrome P450